ncbi:6-phosphofructokinase, partial [Patescibacteria group bacterium]|nr:6-phosphofructokinase [Patescibacteria group bacterium]
SEGFKVAAVEAMHDDSAKADSFGHKKLAGAGKYVAKILEERLEKDPEIKQFMKEQGMFVEGLYEMPEVRAIVPSHLVRSGFTSSYDANFGIEAGAGAVYLLLDGIHNVTVTGYQNGIFSYMDIAEAIARRSVDLEKVELYEQIGFCFGRVRKDFTAKHKKVKGKIDRIY